MVKIIVLKMCLVDGKITVFCYAERHTIYSKLTGGVIFITEFRKTTTVDIILAANSQVLSVVWYQLHRYGYFNWIKSLNI